MPRRAGFKRDSGLDGGALLDWMLSPARVVARGGCKEWQGARNDDGYGVTTYRGRAMLAHRVTAALARGLSPGCVCHDNDVVLHSCDNPRCVNPHHLRFGSTRDNNRERESRNPTKTAIQALRAQGKRTGTVPYGKQVDGDGRLHVNPEEQAVIARMIALRDDGLTYEAVAKALAADGIRNRAGGVFTRSGIHRLLKTQPQELVDN